MTWSTEMGMLDVVFAAVCLGIIVFCFGVQLFRGDK
jgi:hypothetical protein